MTTGQVLEHDIKIARAGLVALRIVTLNCKN